MNILTVLLVLVPHTWALWPMPSTLTTGSAFLVLSPAFQITVNFADPPQDLLNAIAQTKTYLATDNLQRLVPGRGAFNASAIRSAPALTSLVLSLLPSPSPHPMLSISAESVKPLGTRSEGYTLSIPSTGRPAVLAANSTLGLFRGLTTFAQFWYSLDGEGRTVYLDVGPVDVARDAPAYSYRGFMLDTARNFFPVADIKRTLDAMSWVKLNMFHWHIVDSQSFPLSLPDYPELAQKGAYSANEVYSPQDVEDIVQYAAERGIDVLMEIDTPGHTTAIGESHPEYIACNKASPWTTYANEPPAGQLRLATPAVVNFTASLIGAAAKVLPGQYFSTGGDELNTECYAKDAQTQADLKKSGHKLEQALDAFTQATHGALLHLGKTPVVWEEMVLDFNLKLSNETVVMVWISAADAASVVEKNFRIVHSASDYFYLDCGAGEWIGDTSTATSWCDPFKSWQWSYTFDPLANISASKSHLVLGGEQLLWTEQTDPSNLDPIVWPRAATSAEIFWTGPKLPSGKARTGVEALPRLHDLRYRMVQRGVRAIPIQPQWCALRPESCLSAS
ncbi:unnamed protein product [Mycena citricolor]|uniref:Beta-hexosaminidase n=1 Tax=Mycena citricolor TaxID=2018698 RepID=A0AAD2H4G2_9AGAR|nr:unnamed protein product [Mycena citricolor]